jgi:uncharacterized phage protein gp47/JayE
MGGLVPSGFDIETFDDLLAQNAADLKAALGASLNTNPDSVIGQIDAIVSERLALLWELGLAVYNSEDPDVAEGVSLDHIGALTGITRLDQEKSTVSEVLFGAVATLVPAGTVFSVLVTGSRFVTTAAATIVAVPAWTVTTAYAVDALAQNGGNTYSCTIAGTSAGAGGPTGTGTAIVDGTVTWRFIAVGVNAVAVACESEEFGVILAAAGTLTVIETPIGGLTGVVNPLDAIPGREIETDADYRFRREGLLQGAGDSTLNAIFAAVSSVANTIDVRVYENITLITDVDGIPGKAFEVVCEGGVDQEIIDAIGGEKPAGIQAYGQTVTGTFVDDQSFNHTIEFTRPTQLAIYVRYDIIIDPAVFPADGDDQIRAACVAFGDGLPIGGDIIFARVACIPFDIPGVLDIDATFIGLAPAPTGTTNIVVGVRQTADFDTSRVAISHV